MARTGLVFSTDENFAPLAKGLVLSVLAQRSSGPELTLNLIDIGCSAQTRAWMAERGVQVQPFEPSRFMPQRVTGKLKGYQAAQICRPFIPQLFPEFDLHIWCDSDVWIQDGASLRLIEDLARAEPHKLVISPIIDVSYAYFYKDSAEFSTYNQTWFRDTYGPTVASTYARRAVLSSGVFGLSAKSELWSLWAREINTVMQRDFSGHHSLHLAEQTALNYLAYSSGSFIPIAAKHNYNCHIGKVKRDADGQVVVDIPPHERIGIVHLTYTGKMIGQYIDDGLLFDRGAYLSVPEIERLKRIAHY